METQLWKQFRFCCKAAIKNNSVIFQFIVNLIQFNNWSVHVAKFYSAALQKTVHISLDGKCHKFADLIVDTENVRDL